MSKLQKALREMFFIGMGCAVVLYLMNGAYDASAIFPAILLGLMYSPLVWAAYRLIRFMVMPRRTEELP